MAPVLCVSLIVYQQHAETKATWAKLHLRYDTIRYNTMRSIDVRSKADEVASLARGGSSC